MYELYEITKKSVKKTETSCQYNKIEITPFFKELFGNNVRGALIAIAWRIITLGKARAYVIHDSNNKILHFSCVMPKCYKFPFLRKKENDIHIGPCYTDPEYRGMGIYPFVLVNIAEKELNDKNKAFLMINCENLSSIKGAKKVGFRAIALMKKDKFRRHVIQEKYDGGNDT